MEYDLVNRPHPHPLLFEDKDIINEDVVDVVCCRCRLALYPPAFRCLDSDCNFGIHESCIHLPSHIHNTPFHPQHPLLLKRTAFRNSRAFDRSPSLGVVYNCKECDNFQLDISCAIGDKEIPKASGFWMREKYVHFAHPHPLSLSSLFEQQQRIKRSIKIKKSVCVMCEHPIQSGSPSYFCSKSQCKDIHFHKQCAELARVFQNPDCHPHPLFLSERSCDMPCHSCRKDWMTSWVYACTICKFYLHITCIKSFNHIHTFTNIFPNKIPFTCTVCGQVGSQFEFPWCCDKCHALVHKKCAELPSSVMTNEHHHVLNLNYFISPDIDRILCQICGGKMMPNYGGVYACSTCNNFTAHLKCAIETFQTHDHDHYHDSAADHDHHEYLMNEENTNNNNNICDLVPPEEYANLPKTIKPLSRLHPHPLTLISAIPDFIFQCEVCFQHFNGVAYHCKTCLSTLDVRCATLTNPMKHPNHEHPLYLCNYKKDMGESITCEACGEIPREKVAFQCSICHFYLDIRCGTLPVEVRYRLDEHPLKLTYGEGGEFTSDYYCDICEEEREMGVWFYCCRECKYEAHTRCALGEFPYVKSGKHKSHNHPLNPKTLKSESTSSSYFKLAFQCGVCDFTLDEKEERNLDFNIQNVFSRAIQLYHHYPIPEQLIGVNVNLGPFGRTNGVYWKEWVFSTISGFGIFTQVNGLIEGIKIQYVKNGEMVWSAKHGRNMISVINTEKTEMVSQKVICFDYPNEYLVSIHGSYGHRRWKEMKISGITSLTLETNTKTHGPFGDEVGKKFTSLQNGVKIVGIFGSSCPSYGLLASIGFFGVSTNKD